MSVEPAKEPPQSGIYHAVSVGLCEDYPKDSRSLANARRDLDLLKTNHIHTLRISFSWLDTEPAPGQFDWSFWDDFVRAAVDEYGVRLIPYICYTPRWASSSTNDDYWQQPPSDNASFADFVKQIVSRYKDRIHSWEIWNEPDNSYYWRGSVEQFSSLLEAGARAVHDSDPNATVVMGGLAWNMDFLAGVLTNRAAITNVNVINLHNYYETWASEPLERIPDCVGRASDLLRENGAHQPIWLAEVGYSSFRKGAEISGQYRAHFRDEHTPEAQAAALFRVLTLALSSTNISLVTWYRIHDLPDTETVIGDANNRHLGILDQQGRAKPALRALQFFKKLFSPEADKLKTSLEHAGPSMRNGNENPFSSTAAYRCIDNAVSLTKPIAAPAEVHAFEKADGTIIVIGWLKTYLPGTRGEKSGNARDTRTAQIGVDIPAARGSSGRLFDQFGLPKGEVPLARTADGGQKAELLLQDSEITVLEVAPRLNH